VSANTSAETPAKHTAFTEVIRTHLAVTKAIFGKAERNGWRHHPRYLFADLNAGPGRYESSALVGNPVRFVEEAERRQVPYAAWFFEKDPATWERLIDSFRGDSPRFGTGALFRGDHNERASELGNEWTQIRDPAYGMIYADPNNGLLPIKSIQTLLAGPRVCRIDVLVSLSATNHKRVRGGHGMAPLAEQLKSIGKRHIWFREPQGKHGWTFALMSNWSGLAAEFPSLRLIGHDTPEGRETLRRMSFAEWERRQEDSPQLPFPDAPHIGITPNTSLIRDLVPSGLTSCVEPAVSANGAADPLQRSIT
jgi:hypothetical protein